MKIFNSLKYWQKGLIIGLLVGVTKQVVSILSFGVTNFNRFLEREVLVGIIASLFIFTVIGFVIGFLIGRVKGEKLIQDKMEGRTRTYLVAGFIGYVLGSLWGSSLLFEGGSDSSSQLFFAILSLLSSGVFYFFIFATVTYWIVEKKLDKDWTILTVLLFCFSVFYPMVTLELDLPRFFLVLIFPLIYGTSFSAFGINVIMDFFYDKIPDYFSIIFVFLFDLMFFVWLYLEFFKKNFRYVKLAFLVVMFILLTIGMVSCANDLASGF